MKLLNACRIDGSKEFRTCIFKRKNLLIFLAYQIMLYRIFLKYEALITWTINLYIHIYIGMYTSSKTCLARTREPYSLGIRGWLDRICKFSIAGAWSCSVATTSPSTFAAVTVNDRAWYIATAILEAAGKLRT